MRKWKEDRAAPPVPKWLPMSIEMAKAVEADERTDAGKPVEYIDAETGEPFSTGADYGEDDGGSSGSDAGTDGDAA